MQVIKFIKNNYFYILYLPIIFNFLINLFDKFSLDVINLYDIFSSLLLFIFLYCVGLLIKSSFNLPYISTGIITYTFSFYIFENLIYLFSTNNLYSGIFNSKCFLVVVFLITTKNNKKISRLIFSFLSLNIFNYLFLRT